MNFIERTTRTINSQEVGFLASLVRARDPAYF